MKKVLIIGGILLCIFISSINVYAYAEAQVKIEFTDEEKEYIESREPIKIVVDPDWYPYEKIDKNGEYVGVASNIVNLVAQRTGLKFELIPTTDWNKTLEIASLGQADVVTFLNESEERSKWLLFTNPYFVDSNVLISREEHDYISNLSRYVNETMVLPEGTSMEERLRKDYPDLKIIIVASEKEAIEYVNKRKADFTLRSLTMAAYVIKNDNQFNLKIAGEITEYKNQFRMGITNQDKILQSILNKGISTISEQDVQDAINHYISIKIVEGFNYKLFFIVIGMFSVIFIITFYWMRKIHVLNKKLIVSEKNLKKIAEELEKKNVLFEAAATTDVLTGLKNRLYFNKRVDEEFERFNIYKEKISLLIIDLDHFKRINDTYGHISGDEVLKNVSSKLQSKLRKSDLLARWGGEEFIVLLPGTTIDEAIDIAEKLRKEAESLVHENNEVVTISIGVSTLLESESIASWTDRTDKALYHAKRQGRNRYCVSNEVLDINSFEAIKWDTNWNSGHFVIDQQHMDLLNMYNDMMFNLKQENNRYSTLPELEKLIQDVKQHFQYELDILKQNEYTDLENHKKHHDELIANVLSLFERANEGYLLPIDVAHFILFDILIKHLLNDDTKFFSLFK